MSDTGHMLSIDKENSVPVLRTFQPTRQKHRRRLLLVALLAISGQGYAQEVVSNVDDGELVPAKLMEIESSEIELVPPMQNSLRDEVSDDELTPEERIAKRPWLLEKLTGGNREESVKMDPPHPPLADPPSLSKIAPPNIVGDLPLDDGWMERQNGNHVGVNRPHTLKRQAKAEPLPLTDVVVEDPTADQLRDPQLRSPEDASVKVAPPESSAAKPLATPPRTTQPRTTKSRDTTARTTRSRTAQPLVEQKPQPTEEVEVNEQEPATSNFDYAGYPLDEIRLTRSVYQMRNAMYRTLRSYYADMEVAQDRSNWGMMHAMMVYGIDTKVIVGRRTYSTIAWIAGNNACRGQRLFDQDERGIVVKSGVGLQGHQAQLLAVFSLCDVPADYPVYAGDAQYLVKDVIEREKEDCKSGEELTFTLIGLSHYLSTEESWTAKDGEVWDFERLIREELAQPVVGAACGGTHRLMGFGHALRKRRMEGLPITGQWARADKFTQDFIQYAYRLQNRDGSMSTDWFEGREDNGDMDRKIQTTGHMVEWLLTVTPDSELQNPRLVSAVRYLLETMSEERKHDWSIGPKGHALRSLAMYYDRVYKSAPPWRNAGVATRSRQSHR
ncbi:hypothetical protein N9N28_00585 [Rubripirellula amarantea]|nr:hypothetical protein [Rubripirellula amarantea]